MNTCFILIFMDFNTCGTFFPTGVRVACYIFLPLEKTLFLAAYSWTVLLAIRFRRSFNSRKDGSQAASAPPIPYWWIWAGNILLETPTFFISVAGLAATTVGADDDGNSSNWRYTSGILAV